MNRFIMTLALSAVMASASAVPAKRGVWKTLLLNDNTEVRAELRGDEFCHYWQTADGRVFMQSDSTDNYVETSVEAMCAKGEVRRSAANKARVERRAKSRTAAGTPLYMGEKRGLIILANFADKKFTNDNALYQRIANEKGFVNAMGFVGSVSDYFLSQSGGLFNLQFDVVGPVELPNRYRVYGKDNGSVGADSWVGHMIAHACERADTCKLADGSEVNFADYDWDGDGEVDQVFVLYAGQGQAAGGDANTVWPQEGKLSSPLSDQTAITLDGVKIDTYACSCELGVNNTIDGIGTICHEFAHCLGLPDMYDTSSNGNYGMCIWSVMDYGNYMDNSFTPAAFTAYERMACGWHTPIELKNDTVVSAMAAIADGGDTYIIYNDANRNEYYLLENRQKTGWDASLFGSGLLITHVDYDESVWNSNMVNSYTRQRCTVIPADNSLLRTPIDTYRADIAADLYPAAGNNALTNTTTPAATVNNENTDGQFCMNKSLTTIAQNADGTISFRYTNGVVSAISEITVPISASIYTIDGRYAGNDFSALRPGVYIKDGKKIVKTKP